ncbi:helix-turn-helix transcriptional regulator [Bacillus sp. FJAT-49732]|uniref:Helix-turn-helix transcriptional regulator n=1 Tax=Lederbergia citrisecunda TaxID=2833583 RepID=A0A942YMD6_9BACI|nr:AraC family transcriptional regulator [Lederbergia citrisecunda]MBS4200585.1 helix-turn-helix transcriptional regulator [Lederbergia citrisecunda]
MEIEHLKESTVIPDKTFPINVFFVQDIYLHWHDHMEWIIVKEGRACIQIDDSFVELQRGEIAFVNSKQLHAARIIDSDTELIAIVFNGAIVKNNGLDNTGNLYFSPYLFRQLKLPNFLKKEDDHTNKIRAAILRLINEFEGKEKGFELLIKAELFKIFGLILRNYCQIEQLSVTRIQKNYHLTELLDYLRENYNKSITVQQAASMVNLSPNHFCKIFKKVTSKTLIEYLNILRVNEAERILMETDLPITEVAEKVGYGSITYFGRVFKKIKNISPSAIRNIQEK